MDSLEIYTSISKIGESLYKEKGSKFHGFAMPCKNAALAKKMLINLRQEHTSAVHVCFAWRFGIQQFEDRFSDDGEPNNSAGKPILGQIVHHNVTNVLVAVVRYYGGTKLGVGGLISAYKTAANEALMLGVKEQKELSYIYILRYTFEAAGNANIILAKNSVKIEENGFDSTGPFIKFTATKNKLKVIESQIDAFANIELIPFM